MPRKSDPSYKTEHSVFANRLRSAMKARGENQTTLAEKITKQYTTIQRQTISLYMNGQSKPDTERLTAIAKVLGVSADWLLGLSDIYSPDINVHEICDYTGLSELAVLSLYCWKEYPDFSQMLDVFFCSDLSFEIMENLVELCKTSKYKKLSNNRNKADPDSRILAFAEVLKMSQKMEELFSGQWILIDIGDQIELIRSRLLRLLGNFLNEIERYDIEES